eukprot:CAMPEP_0170240182 /NCGR_PEP_ID=MMETSP0116_2-20130129/19848_1 /TAXON_ID=400756 /ORGANISM="Durinskia baltica, Strain CSIRO CS-38" /LENGTH=351 /DNA_ID=CAMNT_0010490999 /DNA_START=132 /DNA_END=1185 /DNA_ORIENTATION=+
MDEADATGHVRRSFRAAGAAKAQAKIDARKAAGRTSENWHGACPPRSQRLDNLHVVELVVHPEAALGDKNGPDDEGSEARGVAEARVQRPNGEAHPVADGLHPVDAAQSPRRHERPRHIAAAPHSLATQRRDEEYHKHGRGGGSADAILVLPAEPAAAKEQTDAGGDDNPTGVHGDAGGEDDGLGQAMGVLHIEILVDGQQESQVREHDDQGGPKALVAEDGEPEGVRGERRDEPFAHVEAGQGAPPGEKVLHGVGVQELRSHKHELEEVDEAPDGEGWAVGRQVRRIAVRDDLVVLPAEVAPLRKDVAQHHHTKCGRHNPSLGVHHGAQPRRRRGALRGELDCSSRPRTL